jgi:hypothetical protein
MQRAVRKLRKKQALSRIAAVALLLREWDPLSLADMAPEDEYDAYAPPIVTLIAEGATSLRIAQHLTALQTGQFGVGATPEENLKVATNIMEVLERLPS